jgi:uncharacterized protein (DUF885 family)
VAAAGLVPHPVQVRADRAHRANSEGTLTGQGMARSGPRSGTTGSPPAECHQVYMNLTDQVAERYVRDAMALDPVPATLAGISGFDDQMADLTPDGFEARAELDRRTIAAIREVAPAGEPEQVARTAMLERLGLAVEQYDTGETTSEINVIASWMHSVRAVFDLMPVEGEQAQRDLAVRMAAVPGAYAGLRRTYAESAAQGRVAA